ncbi:MAG: type II secretion system F family protein [Alphaproteobacteria bacterium]|nr:type II secretion system F family protein [Alphaproteobacteria bacterium]
MTLYRYKALTSNGELQKGHIEAHSSIALKTTLRQQGLSLITYSKEHSFLFLRKISSRALMDLCLHLEQFEGAGIPLKESLRELCQAEIPPKLKTVLFEIVQDVEGGILFSKALAKHPFVFDPIFVGLVAIGEKTGQVSFVLQQLSQHLKWADEVKAQTVKALRYPCIMAVVLLAVIVILMTVLVPELVAFIESFSGDLPPSTRILISFSGFLSRHLFLIFLSVGGLLILFFGFFKLHPKGALWKDLLLRGIPLIGRLRQELITGRFCHIFAVLFESGIDILEALQTARQSLGSGQIAYALKDVETFVRDGHTLSRAFQKTGFFPPLVIRMLKMGEQTSSLQKTLLHVKDYYDTALKRQVDHMVGLIEPFMILSVGLIMGWIIYSVFLPLYDVLSTLDYDT